MKLGLIKDKFLGALVGTMVGDALGMSMEGKSYQEVKEQYGKIVNMINSRFGAGTYTDDTEMMIGVAESLLDSQGFDGQDMAMKFLNNFNLNRGYGAGTSQALNNIEAGINWQESGKKIHGNGSFGNAAAMRVAPIGVFYHDDYQLLVKRARQSSHITHAHPLGKTGAALQALTVGYACNQDPETDLTVKSLLDLLKDFTESQELFKQKLKLVGEFLEEPPAKEEVVAKLGNDIRVFNSVPTAIYSFLLNQGDFVDAVTYAIGLGGDADTLGAMTGAIAGAYGGLNAVPKEWLELMENKEKGLEYIIDLGKQLFELKYKSI